MKGVMMETNGKKAWTENFRIITPMLLTVGIFMLGNLIATTNKIDDKLFKHLTNDEIHAVRATMVSKGEFDIISKMREQQFLNIDNKLNHLEILLEKQMGIDR